jgi:hypothetical protein
MKHNETKFNKIKQMKYYVEQILVYFWSTFGGLDSVDRPRALGGVA